MTLPYWRLSSFYFFYFAILGASTPYWNLYLKYIGFNAAEIGELFALMVGTKIIAPNVFGWLADYSQKSMVIIRVASFFAALLYSGFLFTHDYHWIAWITLSFSFFWNASLPQFEANTLFHLKNEPHRYSHIRIWGSIGFIVAVLGIGKLLDHQPLSLLPLAITLLLGFVALTSLIVPEAPRHLDTAHKHERLLSIIKKPEVLAFFISGTLLQCAHTPYYVFYSIYLKHFHYSALLIGGLWTLGIVAEIVLFLFMKRLLARFSLRAVLLSSIALTAVRWLLIAWYADQLWGLVLAQCLHAASFGGIHAAAIHLIHHYFGHHHQGKGQAFYGSICYGIGGVIGAYYAGLFWEEAGPVVVFSCSALITVVAWLIAYLWIINIPTKQEA